MTRRSKIKKYRKGYVRPDGNGMTGGRWANTTRLAYKDIAVEKLTECISDDDKAEKCLSWLKEKIGEYFRVEAYFDCGYDHSVGLSEYCDMHEVFYPEQKVYNAIANCTWLDPDEKQEICGLVDEICEDEDGYELYEIDYPEE